jgi:poly(beta-D-mannuronate) lyase
MNGVPNSSINRYHQVENATIENNTFVNVDHIQLAAGSDAERSAKPINSVMKGNLVVNQNNQQPFTAFDDVSGIKFSDNLSNTAVLSELSYGFKQQNIALERQGNGLYYSTSDMGKVGAKSDLKVLDKSQTGVDWYPKVPAEVAFDSGTVHSVKNTPEALLNAIQKAESGDIIELSDGQYDIPKLVKIDKALSITAKNPGKAKLTYERSTLFELHDGGSLKLSGLIISGASSPDAAGNSVVRTKKWGMVHNYRFVMSDSKLVDLNINHSFHFFVTGKGAFADEITLTNNTFNQVTGDILRLNTEIEDLGIYNAEYVTLTENSFTNVEGAVVKLYRGGTDESTFGPHIQMANNTLNNVGLGKRNSNKASLYLHGVQVTNVDSNHIINSAPIVVEHTVGEPQTVISSNIFDATIEPSITELRVDGPHTAKVENNTIRNNKVK